MGIVLYNTLSRTKEPLVPRRPGQVGMYVCGVTVYDWCHIGHARVMVVFDVIARYLRASGLKLTYVRNFTDIDDKIIRRAGELGVTSAELTERYIEAFHADMAQIGVAPADVEPKATGHIAEMQALIQQLLDKGMAYESGGDVFYRVSRFADYGRLSGMGRSDEGDGSPSVSRVAADERKGEQADFVLWKAGKPGEPQWPSPWGSGRPGWHIECSAMSCKYLGWSFDIHGGGRDLIFPHHENEIAQTEGASGHPWVRYWLHNGFVNVVSGQGEREKMSKSLGNFYTIRELLARYRGEVLRLFILTSHYRSQLDFSFELLEAARAGLDRLMAALEGAVRMGIPWCEKPVVMTLEELSALDPWQREVAQFRAAMDDDFNTPQALAALFEVARGINVAIGQGAVAVVRDGVLVLRGLGAILGVAVSSPAEHWRQAPAGDEGGEVAQIEAWITQRNTARRQRDFALADRIRQQLEAMGIQLLDGKEGTTWQRQR